MTPEASDPKRVWREWAHRVRSTVDFVSASDLVCASLRSHGLSGLVVAYLPMGDEIDVTSLGSLPGTVWAATRTPDSGPLTVHLLTSDLEEHRYGFSQPSATAPAVDLASIDSVLVPGLVFSRRGDRIGRGAGYYDGLLARLDPRVETIGVAPEAVVVDQLPHEDHDRRVGWIASERGVERTIGS